MGDSKSVIAALKKLKMVDPPEELTHHVMDKLDQYGRRTSPQTLFDRMIQLFDSPKNPASDWMALHLQSALLLFLIGSFYLVAGITAILRLHDMLTYSQFSAWLKLQPFIPAGSGLLMITAALLIFCRPQLASFIQYVLMLHIAFVFVNAVILENIIAIPAAWGYVMILTMLAVVFGLILIESIRSVLKEQVV